MPFQTIATVAEDVVVGLELNRDERRLMRGLLDRRVLVIYALTIAVAVVVSLWQPVVGGVIVAAGLILATNLAVKIVRSQPDQ